MGKTLVAIIALALLCSGAFAQSTHTAESCARLGELSAEIMATKYASDNKAIKMTRPLCAYPRVAKYKGSGSTDEAGNFVCAD